MHVVVVPFLEKLSTVESDPASLRQGDSQRNQTTKFYSLESTCACFVLLSNQLFNSVLNVLLFRAGGFDFLTSIENNLTRMFRQSLSWCNPTIFARALVESSLNRNSQYPSFQCPLLSQSATRGTKYEFSTASWPSFWAALKYTFSLPMT